MWGYWEGLSVYLLFMSKYTRRIRESIKHGGCCRWFCGDDSGGGGGGDAAGDL